MLDLAELRLHLRDEYMRRGSAKDRLRRSRRIIPDPLPTQHKDTPASSNETTPEIVPETRDFDLDGDESSLTSIAAALDVKWVEMPPTIMTGWKERSARESDPGRDDVLP
ncbi:hypothetical protein K503DRAFT_862755 [Rhizopogon vinicolor AM-OR11-026]|uniref:Uncharacterized protein n=1 Tax=Rhizopogon vinicolor AM-OR11-026 TaxID=1314800 RepID=A0A1B7NDF8_9AGAM|nr:hypothetical protein K503DRAFT_862755 [Rhizopogon vinicolor AM-OR11-026]